MKILQISFSSLLNVFFVCFVELSFETFVITAVVSVFVWSLSEVCLKSPRAKALSLNVSLYSRGLCDFNVRLDFPRLFQNVLSALHFSERVCLWDRLWLFVIQGSRTQL